MAAAITSRWDLLELRLPVIDFSICRPGLVNFALLLAAHTLLFFIIQYLDHFSFKPNPTLMSAEKMMKVAPSETTSDKHIARATPDVVEPLDEEHDEELDDEELDDEELDDEELETTVMSSP
ncbi:hypothetical protein THAOC_28136 [Thalassiosira oceanica]|uniref:Uncharacterized protein n=1 Tax=Thalassiosira oceanica TaxID=159749 RepID=K0RUN8_THAOC|nr:hypothetical protein THAOC_28136 [Thalassiosira oceanica]|eukprot:EJK52571.1 hypothetical protein THAOC_28136 [Thalassiosira oceanica]